jgi:hypothetical protein
MKVNAQGYAPTALTPGVEALGTHKWIVIYNMQSLVHSKMQRGLVLE